MNDVIIVKRLKVKIDAWNCSIKEESKIFEVEGSIYIKEVF